VDEFQRAAQKQPLNVVQATCGTLFSRYLDTSNAPFEVDLCDNGIKAQIAGLMFTTRQQGKWSTFKCLSLKYLLQFFDLAKEDILKMLTNDSFQRFVASKDYAQAKGSTITAAGPGPWSRNVRRIENDDKHLRSIINSFLHDKKDIFFRTPHTAYTAGTPQTIYDSPYAPLRAQTPDPPHLPHTLGTTATPHTAATTRSEATLQTSKYRCYCNNVIKIFR
jgi:hypothetical protein